jgi:uncharacterized membrane protein YfcA
MSLVVVGTTSLVGAVGHWRKGHVSVPRRIDFRGRRDRRYVPRNASRDALSGAEQLAIFAAIMLVAAGFMLRGRQADAGIARRADLAFPCIHRDPGAGSSAR